MGSVRERQPRGTGDRMDDSRPLSPRRSRVLSDRDDRTVLPPISQLLPDIDSPHSGRPRSRGSNNSPTSHYPPLSTSRGSSDHSPSYRYQGQPPQTSHRPASPTRHYSDRYQHDRFDLPHHSGPPADRQQAAYSYDGYASKMPSSSAVSNSPYASQPASYHGAPHSTPGMEARRRDEEHHTSLPPPPPYHGGMANHSPYSESRGYPVADGRYDPYPSSSSMSSTQAYPHNIDVSRPYDPRMGPPGEPPSGPYHQSPHNPYSSHPPHPGNPYSSPDEPARKRRGNLPRWTTDIFKAWFLEHIAHPYPSEQEKNELCLQTGCSMTQISNWFINARRRQTPVLTRQAEAERRLRDNMTGRSSSNSD